jgi:FAD/FMN-containing dehydrogenase
MARTSKFLSRPRLAQPTYFEEHLMSTTLDAALVADLAEQVSGSVLGPQDAGYDSARVVHNGLIDRRPALIVRCRTACDVAAALVAARRAGLEVSIRGGGHNVAGRAVTDGGVMIDLAEMKGIAIDPDGATATAEGGVLWGELNDAAAEHGLAVTGGAVSGTGIAGYTRSCKPEMIDSETPAHGWL